MVPSISAPQLVLRLEPLTQLAYVPFGTVVESKVGLLLPEGAPLPQLPEGAVVANQGTAVKQLHVTRLADLYAQAASPQPAQAVVNMFSCAPRALRHAGSGSKVTTGLAPVEAFQDLRFDVTILERHPYTSQTFVPLGVAAGDAARCYLVIVAPTLESAGSPAGQPGRSQGGPPDLRGLRAFVATGAQAVTYAAGTWHAPMVVLGTRSIDFVVFQFANGVGEDDCQEVQLVPSREGAEGVSVHVTLPNEVKAATTRSRL